MNHNNKDDAEITSKKISKDQLATIQTFINIPMDSASYWALISKKDGSKICDGLNIYKKTFNLSKIVYRLKRLPKRTMVNNEETKEDFTMMFETLKL